MNDVTVFQFESNAVRVVMVEGEPWFVGKDVANTLGYSDTSSAIKQHCRGAVKHHPLSTPGGIQEVRIISEPDMYRLVVGSHLPSAQRFETWVFDEVLPAIRKTGKYSVTDADINMRDPAQLVKAALQLIEINQEQAARIVQLTASVAQRDDRIAAIRKLVNEEVMPVVGAHGRITGSPGSMTLTEAAKVLGEKRIFLTGWLIGNKWAYRRSGKLQPYSHVVGRGWLEQKETPYVDSNTGEERYSAQLRVTNSGVSELSRRLAYKPQEAQ